MRLSVLIALLALAPCQIFANADPTDVSTYSKNYISDPTQLLHPEVYAGLLSILSEHHSLTNEKVHLAVHERLDGEDFGELSEQKLQTLLSSFEDSKISHSPRIVVMDLYWAEQQLWIEASYNIEAIIGENAFENLISETYAPTLSKTKSIESALIEAVESTLTLLDSPLLKEERLQAKIDEVRKKATLLKLPKDVKSTSLWLGILAIFTGILMIGLSALLWMGSETHYQWRGIYRINPFIQVARELFFWVQLKIKPAAPSERPEVQVGSW